MPIDRYQIRNVYSLGDPDLYKAADKDDPEALLEGVAMAGLVGVIRQLGDLADFAAEIFHELHEEVTATAARGHGLLVRAQQLELEIPSMERSFMSRTCHSTFFPNSGIDWNPNRKTTQNLITTGDLPRFVMNSYEECRGPPRLFLLDKFDVGGVGACLKRYTDPSFFKVEVSSHEIENAENQRDKKIRKNKKKGSQWKGGVTPEVSPNSKAKLHRLFLEDRLQNVTIESTHRVKLKKRPNKSPFDSESRESYMNKLLSSQSEGKIVHPVPFHPSILIPVPSDSPNQSNREKFMDTICSPFNLSTQSRSPSVSSSGGCRNPADILAGKVTDRQTFDLTTSTSSEADEKKIVVDEEIGIFGLQNGYRSDDVASEMDNYVDALATMESEVETGGESKAKIDPIRNQETDSDQFSDSQLTEIPFRPRVPLEKIPGISSGANEGVILEEGSENEDDANARNEDFVSPAGSLLSFQFFGNYEGEVENEHRNDGCSPIIPVPNILEANKDNHSTTLLESRCSSPHSVISCADEPSFGVSLAEHDSVVEETLGSCEICSLPEEQLKKIEDGDDVLRDFDSQEVKVDGMESNSSGIRIVTRAVSDLDDADKSGELNERDTGLDNSEIEVGITPVYVPDDAGRNDDNALPTHEDDTELEGKGEEEEDSVDSEKLEKNVSSLRPLDVDKNEDTTHSTVEEPESCIIPDSAPYDDNSRKPLLDDDGDDHDDDGDDDGNDNPSLLQDQTHSFLEEKNQIVHQAAVLHADDSDIASGTHVDDQTDFNTHSEPYSVNPASKSEEDLQGKPVTVSVSVPDKPPTLESLQTNGHDIDHFDQVNHQFHSDPCSVKLSSQSEEDPQGIPMTVSVSESETVNSHDIDLVDQVKHQFHSDPNSINLAGQSEEDRQRKPMAVSVSESDSVKLIPQATSHDTDPVDQVNHQFHSDPYSVKLSNQSEEDPHEKPITVSVSENRPTLQATSQDTNPVDQVKHQFHSDPFSVKPSNQSEEDPHGKPVTVSTSEKLPTLQATSHDTNLVDQVKHQFHSDPFLVKLSSQSEEDPQRKPITVSVSENLPTLQATSHDTKLVDQVKHQFHSDPYSVNLAMQNPSPENPSTLELPQPISHDIDLSDQVKHQSPPVFPGFSILLDIPLVKPKDTPTPTTPTPPLPPLPPMQWRMKRLQSPSLSPTDADQHNFPPIFQSSPDEIKNPETENEKSEAKIAEDLVKQQTESGQQVFWPSSKAYLIPQGEEMPNNIRPMKTQRPRSPLIDAVATHDKTKLRKVSDRAMSQITKGQENDKLLEQIRTKSYNLKPAVQTRPNLHGPTTNVRLAAILEKANAIRQAFAGSDDDDDSDSWSDS